MQVPGNCKLATCDGSGSVIEVPDDDNLPVLPAGTSTCVIAACSNGEPATYYEQADAICGSGMVCDATGDCVACNVPVQCPGTDNQCEARTCINNTCGMAFSPSGFKTTSPPQPAAGTCFAVKCDGSGSAKTVIDDTNVPPTTTCAAGSCDNGTPVITPQNAGSACTISGGGAGTCDGAGNCT
jgi:hypothetical protein